MPRRPAPTSRSNWPPEECAHRRLLEHFDKVREREGRKSVEKIARDARLAKSRVSQILTAARSSQPSDLAQVELLLRKMGGGDDDVVEGCRLFRAMQAENGIAIPADTPRVSFIPADRPPFVSRGELETRYETIKSSGVAVVLLAGPSGVGKSALAEHLATGFRAAGPTARNGRWMIRCATDWDVVQSLHRILPPATHRSLASLPALEDAFRTYLRQRRPPLGTLVFDDVVDDQQLRRLLPDGARGDFIVTSRTRLSAIPASARIEVGPMDDQEAVALVCLLANGVRQPEAGMVATAAGNNPLAIEALCGMLNQDPDADRELIRELGGTAAWLLAQPDRYGRPGAAAAYHEQCRKLREDDPLALRLLGLIAYSASGPLETAILMSALLTGGFIPDAGLRSGRAAAGRCLARLQRSYLIRPAADSPTAVEMHSLTRTLVRDALADLKPMLEAELHDAVLGILSEHLRADRTPGEVLEIFPQLMHFGGRHILSGAGLETGTMREPMPESMPEVFLQILELSAKLLQAIGADPSQYMMVCQPTGKDQYSLGLKVAMPMGVTGRVGNFVRFDVADLKEWAPDDNHGKVTIQKAEVRIEGPDGPQRMFGLLAMYE